MRSYWNGIGSRRGPNTAWWRARHFWLSVLAATAGLLVSASVWVAVSHQESELAELELSSLASGHSMALQSGIDAYLRKVSGLRALFDSSGDVSRDQFEKFTKASMTDRSAILGMSWIPRVTLKQRAIHERAAVLDGIPGYRIKAVGPDGSMSPAPDKSEYFPVFYTATEPADSPVYGLDLHDGGMRQKTLEHASDGETIATSAQFTLQTGSGDRRGFFVVLPVYTSSMPHETIKDRERNLQGYVQAVFQTSVLIETILRASTTPAGLDLYFYPADYGRDTSALIYFHGSRSRAVPIEPLPRAALTVGPHWIGALNVGDARWTVVAVPIPGGPGIATHTGAWLALFGCLFVSAIGSAYIWRIGSHAQRLETANTQLDQTNKQFAETNTQLDKTLGLLNTVNADLSARNLQVDAALNNMVQGFVMFDSQERIVVCNKRFTEMYGLSREIVKPGCSLLEVLQHRAAIGHSKFEPHRYRDDLLAGLAKGKIVNWVSEMADGRQISITSKPLPEGGWIVTHEDITERRRTDAKIAHMAMHDGLTDLANAHSFDEQIARCLEKLGRGEKFAVLCLGLDHFKNVNDTLGHPIGDKLLKLVGARLRDCVRESDTVARLGGDEFAILQRDAPDPAEVRSLGERVVEVIGTPFELDGNQIVVGVSVGIALAPNDATNAIELLKAADLALLRAKTDGRGTYRFFDSAMDERAQARQALERDLRKALALDQLVVHYQPLVNLESGRIACFEALIRWNHPTRGMIPPIDFISIAEETAQIGPIGEWVLRQACKEATGWPDDVGVAVNLSPVQVRKFDLCQIVSDALACSGLAARRLELEITESVLLRDAESTLETLRQLRALGVRIVMDDFGTGYSSLNYLIKFPFDKIKIDCCFVKDLWAKKESRAIIQAVTQLASSLGMKTTAECVETRRDFDFLRRVGCTEGQGYLFSKAVPAKDAHTLLERQVVQTKTVA
jgi:diguanylate cyclase (GGDEF)-like protein